MNAPMETPKAPRWMKVTLGLSLAVNLLIAGVVAGAMAFGPGPGARGGDDRNAMIGPFARALDASDRDALRDSLRSERGALRETRQSARAVWRELLAIVRAEPFDIPAFEAGLARQQALGAETMSKAQSALVQQIAAMTPADRAAYAERVEEVMRRGR